MLNKIGKIITSQFERKDMDAVVKKLERSRTKEQPLKKNSDALGAFRSEMTCQTVVVGRNADGIANDWRTRVLDSLNERVETQKAADEAGLVVPEAVETVSST